MGMRLLSQEAEEHPNRSNKNQRQALGEENMLRTSLKCSKARKKPCRAEVYCNGELESRSEIGEQQGAHAVGSGGIWQESGFYCDYEGKPSVGFMHDLIYT